MKRLLLILTCVLIAGCATRDFVPTRYSFSPYSGAKFSVNSRVWVYNATPSMVEKVGTNLKSDLRDWGKQLTYGLERSLECRGATIDRKARKKISVRITHAEVKNKILKYTASMECVVRLGNGYSKKIIAHNNSTVDEEACSGLLPVVIERIMSNPSVVRYLSAA